MLVDVFDSPNTVRTRRVPPSSNRLAVRSERLLVRSIVPLVMLGALDWTSGYQSGMLT